MEFIHAENVKENLFRIVKEMAKDEVCNLFDDILGRK